MPWGPFLELPFPGTPGAVFKNSKLDFCKAATFPPQVSLDGIAFPLSAILGIEPRAFTLNHSTGLFEYLLSRQSLAELLEFVILQLQPPKCQEYRHALPCLA